MSFIYQERMSVSLTKNCISLMSEAKIIPKPILQVTAIKTATAMKTTNMERFRLSFVKHITQTCHSERQKSFLQKTKQKISRKKDW